MAVFEDLTGRMFGFWTVVSRAPNNEYGSARWICRCECGKEKVVAAAALRKGQSKSCGCHKNDYNRKHGGKGSRLYECWRHMRYRCQNPSNQAYKDYGARGIAVCPEWEDFGEFQKWALANGYDENKTIDRKDVNGNYCPENCRWADSTTQMNNRRTTPHYEYQGELLTVSQIARKLGISRNRVYRAIKAGKSIEQFAAETRQKKAHGE